MHNVQNADYWKNRPIDDPEKDWKAEGTWIDGYVASENHPHRQLIIDALDKFHFRDVLEIGCSTGPNLSRISKKFDNVVLSGIDVNEESIERAREILPQALLKVGEYTKIPFGDRLFDVTIADATLLYASPEEIHKVIDEIDRVTKGIVILVERYSDSIDGEIVGHVWGRNYPELFTRKGFIVEGTKLDEKTWPHSENWQKHGWLYVCRRA